MEGELLSLRQNFVIIIFVFICAGTIVLSFNSRFGDDGRFDNSRLANDKKSQESYFKKADYYLIGIGRENFHLFSDELIHNQGLGELILTGPNGVLFSKEGEPVYYSANSGFFKVGTNNLHLKESVNLRSKEALINSDELIYTDKHKRVEAIGNVFSKTQNMDELYEVRIKSEKMTYFPLKKIAHYNGNVDGKIERKRVYEQPVFFKSDKLKLSMLDKKADLDGNVFLQKQEVKAQSLRGEIFLENYNKKLKYFALYDDVIIKEIVAPPGKPSFERKAFSEKLEGYTSEGLIVLLGYPKVYQRRDVLKGNVIILRENNETIEVDDANTNFKLR